MPNLTFALGDGRKLPYDDRTFDVVVCHTLLCHVPEPEEVLAEAARLTAPGGRLAAFDGDYATTTVAIGAEDPLQDCIRATLKAFMHDPYLVRRLPLSFGRAAGRS